MTKRALVVEGGGMKAAYANGVLSAFEELGHTAWDAIYGTSAGGALAAWFAAGQARHAEKTWEYAADRRILSYRRFLRRKTFSCASFITRAISSARVSLFPELSSFASPECSCISP